MIVGLTGHAGAGKDTVAQMLVDHGATRVGLADMVKVGVTRLNPEVGISVGYTTSIREMLLSNGWDDVELSSSFFTAWDVVKGRMEARRLLQVFGTEVGRGLFGEGIWLELAGRRVAAANTQIVVIPDVRFANEAAWVRDQGGLVVHVKRPGVGPVNGHASDALDWLDEVDHITLPNDDSLEALRETVDDMVAIWTAPVVASSVGTLGLGMAASDTACKPLVCPDCRAGKHGNCTNQSWCTEHDHEVECPCTDVSH